MAWTRKRNPKGTRFGIYKSGLELSVATDLERQGVPVEYEVETLPYTISYEYTPDFRLPNGILVETKGYFDSDDRRKMKAVKEANPDRDIRLVFSNSNNKISKGSQTTYAMWAEKYGFPWADKLIPREWLRERKKRGR